MKFHKPQVKLFLKTNRINNPNQSFREKSRITEQNQLNIKQETGVDTPSEQKGRCSLGGETQDMGNAPVTFNLIDKTCKNENFRTALWTGKNLQLTTMFILPGEDIGEEMHDSTDQLIFIVSGNGEVSMSRLPNGAARKTTKIGANDALLIPGGTYHNVKNTGDVPLRLYSVYAPKVHKFGTVQKTKPK